MSTARSSLLLSGARAASIAVGLLAVIAFARELGAAALGSFFLFQAVLSVVAIVSDAGLRSAVEKRISEGQAAGAVLTTGLGLKLATLAAVGGGVLLVQGPLAEFVGADLAGLLVVVAGLREAGRLTTAVLRAELRVGASATVEITRKLVYAAVGVALAVRGYGVLAPVYGLVAGYGAMAALGAVRMHTRPARPSAATARSLVSFARHRAVTQLGGIGYSWVDVLAIGAFLSPAAVAAYEVAWRVAQVATLFGDALATAAFSRLSDLAGRDETDRITAAFPRLVTASLLLVVPAFFGTLVVARDVLGLVFGPAYAVAAAALVLLMADNVSSAVVRVVHRTLGALDRPDLTARSVLVTVALLVVLNLLLVPRFGLAGAAVATGLASLLGNWLAYRYLRQLLAVRLPWRAGAWITGVSAAMAAVVWAVRTAVGIRSLATLAVVVGIGVVVYAGLAAAAPPLRALATAARAGTLLGDDPQS